MIIMPQKWVEKYEKMPDSWLKDRAPRLIKKVPDIEKWIDEICYNIGVSWKMIPVRIELEQGAISYAWDNSRREYPGKDDDKLKYLCGADKTDSGPRKSGWFGPRKQMMAYVLRFKYWYRGINPSSPNWENWLKLKEDPKFKTGVPITRGNITIIPFNQISADCLRYTSSMKAQYRLRDIVNKWFSNDYNEENKLLI